MLGNVEGHQSFPEVEAKRQNGLTYSTNTEKTLFIGADIQYARANDFRGLSLDSYA
jgi:hypothetical protein